MISSFLLLLAQAATPTAPLPPGDRPLGPLDREDVIPGWNLLWADMPQLSNCAEMDQPLVRPLNPPHREEGVALLERVAFRKLSDREATHLLGIEWGWKPPLAASVFEHDLSEMRKQKESHVGWSLWDENNLKKLTADFAAADLRRYRPYLVRAVSSSATDMAAHRRCLALSAATAFIL